MINRIVIRVKVLQTVYACYQKNSKDLVSAETELLFGLEKFYDLYHYLLLLIVLLTDAEQKRIDKNRNKLLATEQELNPNRRMADNRLAEQLRTNSKLTAFSTRKGALWNSDDSLFLRNLLKKIIQSDCYKEYLESANSYESDRDFWRKVFKYILMEDAELSEILEDTSIYWSDDLDVIGTFVLKTIKRFSPETGTEQELLPMFKNEEDREFAVKLLHHTLLEEKENNERINRQISNWELDRIAQMDLYIMQIALSELLNFPDIPVSVTLNEYIDLSRYYSTPKSPNFINGILDSIVRELKSEGKLFKDE
ncbi:MAG: transcription antitermination factor NusB [Dysgonamonadaceae bacterium]|jgi:N utilization substance protein B|nr:transcription antitermination factor NusB [Dysgonamonadaceae bacterium]